MKFYVKDLFKTDARQLSTSLTVVNTQSKYGEVVSKAGQVVGGGVAAGVRCRRRSIGTFVWGTLAFSRCVWEVPFRCRVFESRFISFFVL